MGTRYVSCEVRTEILNIIYADVSIQRADEIHYSFLFS
jgi:hypothetical protein